jgi:squalene-associated FAD-dependent desaturase
MTTLVIGGGWSGLAAAITLCQHGEPVQLLESAKQLGGRARNVTWQDKTVDNGQHLMIGAYHDMLEMMAVIGADPKHAFERKTIDLSILDTQYPTLKLSGNHFLPWPLSLAWSLMKSSGLKGLLQVKRLQNNIPILLSTSDISVAEWLDQTKQSDRLIKQLWEPLCLATLNTPIAEASAHVLATVIQDSLGQGKQAADLLIPKQALGDLFPRAAAKFISQHGGEILLQTRVTELVIENNQINGVKISDGKFIAADKVIVATAAQQSSQLLAKHIETATLQHLPIVTVYLQYESHCKLTQPMFGMTGSVSQWIFDRGQQHAGLMAIVISGPGQHETMSNDELIKLVTSEVKQFFPQFPAHAKDALVIREKRATFASTVNIGQQRPSAKTKISGLYLAGDYINNSYPATLEGAIRNGKNVVQEFFLS